MTSEWKNIHLGEVCNITSSKRIFAKEYQLSGIPFYRGKEIIEKHKGHKVSTELFISQERFDEIKAKYDTPKIGDVLLSSVGTLGVPWYVDETDFYFKDGNLTWLRADSRYLDSQFLYLWLNSNVAKEQIDSMCIGSTQKALTIDTLNKFVIMLPPLDIQRRIATILWNVKDKIAINTAINENLEQQAQAIFKSWFVDAFNDDRKICRADEYFDISIGKTPPRKEHQWFTNNSNDTIWVSISDMGGCGMFIENSSEYLTKDAVKKFNIKIVPANTVILSFKLTIGRVAITANKLTTNEAIAHFKTNNQAINEYLYCYLKQFNYQSLGSTSSIAVAVNSKIIKGMPFVVPTDEEISDFHNLVYPMFKEILKNQQENHHLADLRDTLLPKLMSGENDVSKVKI